MPAGPALLAKVPIARQSEKIVYFAAVGGPNQVLGAVGSGPEGGPAVQLLATTAAGNGVRDIGPRVPANELPDNVFFLDSRHGWFASSSAVRGETLYRTGDGGRSWQAFRAPGQLVTSYPPEIVAPDASHAWLIVAGAGAGAGAGVAGSRVYVTDDAGKTWQRIDQKLAVR
ncbi:MAG: WD40/YVTN/BNR-like repeat-containing protein [Streptosporangiaceae bacterium]